MNKGDPIWVLDGTWQEASYEFRVENNEPLGHHSVYLKNGHGRRVVCGCDLRLEKPPTETPQTLKEAESLIASSVYQAAALLERLEAAGLIRGNGHHARQKLAQLAVEELRSRWTA